MRKSIISNSLWVYRKRNGLSQKRVAFFLAHKTPSQLSHYERGVKCPGLINALKLEIIYRVPVAYLFRDLYQDLKRAVEAKEIAINKRLENE